MMILYELISFIISKRSGNCFKNEQIYFINTLNTLIKDIIIKLVKGIEGYRVMRGGVMICM